MSRRKHNAKCLGCGKSHGDNAPWWNAGKSCWSITVGKSSRMLVKAAKPTDRAAHDKAIEMWKGGATVAKTERVYRLNENGTISHIDGTGEQERLSQSQLESLLVAAMRLLQAKSPELPAPPVIDDPPPRSKNAWLTLAEAADILGLKAGTVQDLCNHVDRKTGLHSPKIEHARFGNVGRPSSKHGLRGVIRIRQAALDAYIEANTHREREPPPKPAKPIPYKCKYL